VRESNGQTERAWLLLLAAAAIVVRAVLTLRAPTPYGYVFDFYHEAIQKTWALGRLAIASDCWQCYHPPLFTLVGLPFYATGRWIAGGDVRLDEPAVRFVMPVALGSGAVVGYYAYRLLRGFEYRGFALVSGVALALVFPCLVISSYGLEADVLLSALMSAFLYYAWRWFDEPARASTGDAVRVGMVAGLACATKYTGLIAPAVFGILSMAAMVRRADRRRVVQHAALVLIVCAVLGSWKYVDNLRRYGTPLFANGSALEGFTMSGRLRYAPQYDFTSLRMRDLVRLTEGRVRPGPLTDVPFYRSVWTTLHAMAWGDMSFFSDPSRHGFYRHPFPAKTIHPLVASSVLMLGLAPGFLALVGFATTLHRRRFLPLAITAVLTMASYIAWFLAQESWALKTKYVLFLLPAYVVYVVMGLRRVEQLSPIAGDAARVLLVLLIVLAHVYVIQFAWG
jgi:hypothetical protein